ncbi:MAG: hypothetical protein IJQ80_07390 [Clostridia bacterium]|nr:hypothetical protein [Clostridia bacterium]
MRIAEIDDKRPAREDVRCFFGLNRRESRQTGESRDEENVTGELSPFLSTRRDAVKLTDSFGTCCAIMMKDHPAWVTEVTGGAASKLYYAGLDTSVVLSPGKKQLVSMGTKIIVFPDKVWYDTVNGESGSLDAEFSSEDEVTVTYSLSRLDGAEYDATSSAVAPPSPADGAYWCDTSGTTASLMRYSESSGTWSPVDSTFIKISTPGIGAPFSVGDGVVISSSVVSSLNGAHVIEEKGDGFIVVAGIITSVETQSTPITVSRRAPAVDLAVEYSNRIWACRSGLDNNGRLVNEIYATKLGDPFNWNCFAGLASDSYAAGVGSDGPFTGAAVFLGYVMFFKERCVHKVFGTKPSNYQVITSNIRGVARGAESSLCVMDEMLYFAGVDGIMAYDGAVPEVISEPLGEISPDGCCAASRGRRLFVSAKYGSARDLYVYDTKSAVWHRYSPLPVEAMAGCSAGVFAAAGGSLYVIDSKDGGAAASDLTGYASRSSVKESWYFETGELTAETEDRYVERVEISCAVAAGGEMTVELITEEDGRVPVVTLRPTVRRTFVVPVVTGRHRRARIKVSGYGDAVVYSMAKFVKKC